MPKHSSLLPQSSRLLPLSTHIKSCALQSSSVQGQTATESTSRTHIQRRLGTQMQAVVPVVRQIAASADAAIFEKLVTSACRSPQSHHRRGDATCVGKLERQEMSVAPYDLPHLTNAARVGTCWMTFVANTGTGVSIIPRMAISSCSLHQFPCDSRPQPVNLCRYMAKFGLMSCYRSFGLPHHRHLWSRKLWYRCSVTIS